MNAARVASLLRQLADEIDPVKVAPKVKASAVERRRRPPPPRLLRIREPSELDRAAARAELQRLGFRPR
jgi:hypothetical protein